MSQQPLEEIIAHKAAKVAELRARGVDPYPPRAAKTHGAREVAEGALDREVGVAGRLVAVRVMGKAAFTHLEDESGRIQLYFKQDTVGPQSYASFKDDLAVGDFISAAGKVFKSKTGETTVWVATWTLLAKAVRPLPEKWHGLKDVETRHRHRHLDLLADPARREAFRKRSLIVDAVRRALNARGFLEVETPVLTPQAGGASATPFVTHHNALDMRLYLRIATELYLKRLIIGGLERVYEIGRIFRNEGIDTRHNPEFTMLEAYQAYTDYHGMADLCEGIVGAAAEAAGVEEVEYKGRRLRVRPPFRRLYLPELWKEHCGADIREVLDGLRFRRDALLALARRLNVAAGAETPGAKVFERVFDAKILPHLWEPAFVLDHPTAITPLAKAKPGVNGLVERFEFFAAGEELANAYTELNDPAEQRARFEQQARVRAEEKDSEAEVLDEDFVQAMETGMPPTGGIGIGIDRLVMLLTGQASIREVILFPTLRPEADAPAVPSSSPDSQAS